MRQLRLFEEKENEITKQLDSKTKDIIISKMAELILESYSAKFEDTAIKKIR